MFVLFFFCFFFPASLFLSAGTLLGISLTPTTESRPRDAYNLKLCIWHAIQY